MGTTHETHKNKEKEHKAREKRTKQDREKRCMDSDTEFALVEAPVQPAFNRRVANLLDEEKGNKRNFNQFQKTKRKRCDTWHGDENKPESQLDPDIEQGLNTKRKFARKNAWGYCSYADLITMALERAPSKQMTLAEIYDWIVANIPFFKDKGDHNSSIGWKNSIRHNLSLHDKFSRVTPTNTTKNIGAYWTLVPENDDTKTKGRSEMESMSPPASTSVPSPPSNFRKRSSTMPTNLNRPQRPSKFKRNSPHSLFDANSVGGDSGILSRHSSCNSLAANNVTEEMARINLETSAHSPQGGQGSNHSNGDGRIIEENLEVINKFNREAKINPDNSVLVEVSLTAEQFELVKSGRYIVSLCDTMAMDQINDPKLNLTNWKAKPIEPPAYNDHINNGMERYRAQSSGTSGQIMNNNISAHREMKPNTSQMVTNVTNNQTNVIPIQQKQNMNHPFSPLSSESSGIGGHSSSPPTHQPIRNEPIMNTPNLESEREVKREVKHETDVFSEHMADSIATGGIFDMDDFNLNAEFNLINDFDLPTNF